MAIKPVSVSQLNGYIKRILQTDPLLGNVSVVGEVSNLKYHGSGHVYFTLKDANSKISCFLPHDRAEALRYELSEGMEITASGYIHLYERGGSYSLNIRDIEVAGLGNLAIAFEKLKSKLEAEGLFDPAKKKAIPSFPEKIAVVTSETGAAVRDILKIIKNRNDYVDVLIYPVLVQGPAAAGEIVAAINHINEKWPDTDTIITGRGGGSMEELWAFNEEIVARAIYASAIPVISAVGHETDFTICDFVADRRAPTPSAAAELAVPETSELKRKIQNIVTREADVIGSMLKIRREKLISLANTRAMTNPMNFIDDRRMTADLLGDRLKRAEESILQIKKAEMAKEAGKLSALNPLSVISRGYSAVYKEDGKLVKNVDDVTVGEKIEFKTIGGQVACTVDEIKKNK